MRKTYKAAMDQITVSEALRERVLAAAAARESSFRPMPSWIKPAVGFAACLMIVGGSGIWMHLGGIGYNTSKSGSASYSATTAAPAESTALADAALPQQEADGEASSSAGAPAACSFDGARVNTPEKSEKSGDISASQEDNLLCSMDMGSVVTYETLEAAQEDLSFTALVPGFLTEYTCAISVIDQKVLQIEWKDSTGYFVYRTAQQDVALTDDWSGYEVQETVEVANENAVLCGDGETVSLILWQYKNEVFSLSVQAGILETEAEELLEACLTEDSAGE